GDTIWTKTYGGSKGEDSKSVIQTSDGGYIIAGSTISYGSGGEFADLWLIKTDSLGDSLWTIIYGGSSIDGGNCVQETLDGGFIVCGVTKSYGAGQQDVLLIKTNSQGSIEWDKTYGAGNDEQAYCVRQTSDSGYIFTAFTRSYGAGSEDFWLVKTDESGNKIWDKTFGGSGWDHPESVHQTLDDGYIITGYTDSYGAGGYDVWVIKTDSDGNEKWNKTFGGSGDDRGYSIQQTTDGGYILAGKTESYGAGSSDVWLIKLESEINVGLVAYYPFNGNASDKSGNGNDGIVYGATLTSDRFEDENNAYSFDGVDNYIDCGNNETFNIAGPGDQWSVSLWFQYTGSGVSPMITKDLPSADGWSTYFDPNDKIHGRLEIDGSPTHSFNHITKNAISDNKWHLLNVIWNSGAEQSTDAIKIFIDGVKAECDIISPYGPNVDYNTIAPFYIGRKTHSESYFFKGKIDDVYIHDRALTETEIKSLYHIVPDSILPVVTLSIPSSGYRYGTDDLIEIQWEANDNIALDWAKIYFAPDILAQFEFIDSVDANSGSYEWQVPDSVISSNCRMSIVVSDYKNNIASDTSGIFSIFDNTRPVVSVLTPQEGFSIPEYEDITVTWVATDNIQLDCIIVSYSKDGGYSGRTMGVVSPDTNYFTFQIPSGVTDSATIRVKAKDIYFNTGAEFSPLFSVTDNTPPEVDLLSMFSDSSFEIMSTRSIFWTASDNVAIQSIDLAYSIDAGDTWISISENESNDGEYSWLIPNTPSDQCKIKIAVTDSVGLSDEAISAGLFTIYVTYPKLISHSTIISPLDTIQLRFSQALNIEQFSTGLALSSAIEENLTCDLQFLNNNQDVSIYPENSFVSGDTISLILSADQITNAYGYGLDGNQNDAFEGSPLDNDTVTVCVNYSGDFDGNDQVDFDDLTLFANGWYSKDYKYELGPVTGNIPHFITLTDSLFNIEDAMTFGRMWNWFVVLGKHAVTMPQLSFGGGFTTEQKGNDLIIHSRASAGKRIVFQYDPEIITINKKQQSLSKPTDLTFEFYADCIDSNRSEYVHYSFNEELSNIPVIFTVESKQRNPVNITIGIEGINETGALVLSGVITTRFQLIPDKFEVFPNYPNPFNSQTVIEYAIPIQSDVLINIYDLLGRKVKTLTNNRHEAKYYTLVWDGKDEQGRLAASGLYFLRIVARSQFKTFAKTSKMVMIR
ncbi:MAG: T9SS type A sorting domain-containing protein, partial [Candidatus Marinimicrobia bacterium]|nr:T9SS type A sorting domain-containing protein [Candidatus Neomarinimicrobiota bacterium]